MSLRMGVLRLSIPGCRYLTPASLNTLIWFFVKLTFVSKYKLNRSLRAANCGKKESKYLRSRMLSTPINLLPYFFPR
jgi:hypothetical protein